MRRCPEEQRTEGVHRHERAEAADRSRDPPAAPHTFVSAFGGRAASPISVTSGRMRLDVGPNPRPGGRGGGRRGAPRRRLRRGRDRGPARRRRDPAEGGEALVHALRLDDDELDDAIRLLLLSRPVARSSFAAASELVRLGLATEEGAQLVPRARIVPTEACTSRSTRSRAASTTRGLGGELHADCVLARLADAASPVTRALDIGTGNGVHALLAARHADHVIATDVNPRALAFTADQRRAERPRQRRDAARQPVRAGRRRDIRPHHLQRAVRHLAEGALAVPRCRLPGRRVLASSSSRARQRIWRTTASPRCSSAGSPSRRTSPTSTCTTGSTATAATHGSSASRAPTLSTTRRAGTTT